MNKCFKTGDSVSFTNTFLHSSPIFKMELRARFPGSPNLRVCLQEELHLHFFCSLNVSELK